MSQQDAAQLKQNDVSLREQHVQQNYKQKYEKKEGPSVEPMSPAPALTKEESKNSEGFDMAAPEWKPKNPYEAAKEREQQLLNKPA